MRAPNLVALLTLLAVLAAAAAPGGAQQPTSKNPVELYTEAKFQEESRGAVDRAIELYRQVLNHPAASASLKAQALYREGLCQVRKDDFAAARAAFERLLKEHPRTEPAAHAKLMLKTLGASKTGMAAPRDISIEVKEQLIRGTKNSKETREALKTLVFYGAAAKPALREALLMQDRSVHLLALNALAEMGDMGVFYGLLEVAGNESFRRRLSGYRYLSEERALQSLCRAHKAAIPRVAKAYLEAKPGPTKANLMRVLVELKRYDQIPDYKEQLESENADMRAAAWEAYSRIAFANDGKADVFLADLLKAWNAHPDRQAELSRYLFKTGRDGVKRDPALAGPWQKTLLAAAASKDLGIVREVARGLGYLDLGHQLPIRTALLASPDRKVREQAAALRWNLAQPRPELDPAQLNTFANTLVDTAAEYRAREEQHSMTLLNALAQKLALLDPAAYAALVNRIFTPPLADALRVDGPEGLPLPQAVLQIFTVASIQGAYSEQDRYFSLAEKYVPVLTAYAAPGKPLLVRKRCFRSLGQIVQRAWSFLPAAEQERIKQAYFAGLDEISSGGLRASEADQLKRSLDQGVLHLVGCRPRIVTIDEVLQHGTFGPVVRGMIYRDIHHSLVKHFSPKEVDEGFLRGVTNPKVAPDALLRLLSDVKLAPEKRDRALRELWTRANPDERAKIAGKLAKTGRNLKFLTEAIRPEADETEAMAIQRRLANWGSREAAPGLVKLLDARSDPVKIQTCSALGSLADPRAVPKLIELLSYHNDVVRSAAGRALTSIRNIDKLQAEWREWHERQGKQSAPKEPKSPTDR